MLLTHNQTKYFSHYPLSADTSFKFLSLILFEIMAFTKFQFDFFKGEIIQKNTRLLFFHEESIHEVSRRYLIPEYHSSKI